MLRKSGPAIAAAAIFLSASASTMADNAFPSIDMQARCRASENSLVQMLGEGTSKGQAFDTCMKSETEARNALKAAWTEIPSYYKSYCVNPRSFSASYVEWIACVELLIDLRKQRQTNVGTFIRTSRGCPSLEYKQDGSIVRLKACAL
jgi:hypothetical protein